MKALPLIKEIQISDRVKGILAVITVDLILGSVPSVVKEVLIDLTPEVQLALRFTIAGIIFLPFVRKVNFDLLKSGAILGVLLFAIVTFSTIGLKTISAHQASFIFGFNIVFITLFEIVFRQSFKLHLLLASILAFSGIGIMCWEGGEPLTGNLWQFGAAIADAAYILIREKITVRHSSLALTTIQIWVIAFLSLLWAAPELLDQLDKIEINLGWLIYLGIIGSGLMTLMMTIAQRWVSAQEVAVLLSLEPVFGAIFAFLLLGETFGIFSFFGAVMVLFGIFLMTMAPTSVQSNLDTLEIGEN